MRIAHLLGLAVAVVLQLVLLSSCTTPLPATVTRAPVSPLKSNPKIFVRAAAQRERIVESLRNAGLAAMNSSSAPDTTLEVRVGRSTRSPRFRGTSPVATDAWAGRGCCRNRWWRRRLIPRPSLHRHYRLFVAYVPVQAAALTPKQGAFPACDLHHA